MKGILYFIWQWTWGILPYYNQKRKTEQISYFSCFTEKWANDLGEKVTGQKSMETLIID